MSTPAADSRAFPQSLVWLARLVARLFFRRIEVVGADLVPATGPVLVVANHQNSLVDPILIAGFLPRAPRFLGKATLWQQATLAPFLRFGRVIPVFRRQDPGFDASRNEETFDAARSVLAVGGAIALFPEGRSHSEPRLVEIRTGAARIVAGLPPSAFEQLAIVPVGLHFEDKGRFRSGALVRVGEPLRPADLPGEVASDPRALTAAIAETLDAVTLSYPSIEVARRVERAVEVAMADEGTRRPRLADQVALRKQVSAAYAQLAATRPQELELIEAEIDAWSRLLAAMGLHDHELARAPLPGRRWVLAKLAARILLEAPLSVLGALVHWPAYHICGKLGERVGREPDLPATYKMFGGLFLFPLTWLLIAAVAALSLGTWLAALAALVVMPLLGLAALRLLDRRGSVVSLVRTWWVLAPAGRRERLLERRRALRARLLELAAQLGLSPGEAA